MELRSVELRDSPVVIAPIGDIQYAGDWSHIALGHLRAHISRCVDLGAQFLGLGDYIDFASPSNRRRLAQADLYDTSAHVLDMAAAKLNDSLDDVVLADTYGRWLGMLSGHHFYEYADGTTSDQELAMMLGAPFLGSCAMIRLHFHGAGNHTGAVTLWAHHGTGSGGLTAPMQKLEKVANSWDADIFVMGHMTKCGLSVMNRIRPVFHGGAHGRLEHHSVYLVAVGGWSKAYTVGAKKGRVPRGDYVELGMMQPAALGAPLITVTPCWEGGIWAPKVNVSFLL